MTKIIYNPAGMFYGVPDRVASNYVAKYAAVSKVIRMTKKRNAKCIYTCDTCNKETTIKYEVEYQHISSKLGWTEYKYLCSKNCKSLYLFKVGLA